MEIDEFPHFDFQLDEDDDNDDAESVQLNPYEIELIVYDFDGVLTDNRVLVSDTGQEFAFCNRADGFGIAQIKKHFGIAQIIMTSETSPIAYHRAKKLDIPIFYGIDDKRAKLTEILEKEKLNAEKTIFIGNDMNDYGAMDLCGYPMCPKDAHWEIQEISYVVFKRKGGNGIAHVLYDLLMEFDDGDNE